MHRDPCTHLTPRLISICTGLDLGLKVTTLVIEPWPWDLVLRPPFPYNYMSPCTQESRPWHSIYRSRSPLWPLVSKVNECTDPHAWLLIFLYITCNVLQASFTFFQQSLHVKFKIEPIHPKEFQWSWLAFAYLSEFNNGKPNASIYTWRYCILPGILRIQEGSALYMVLRWRVGKFL